MSFHLKPPSNSIKTIIIALSGGADSVCLTHLLWQTQKYKIILVHFNHQLRKKESKIEEIFVQNYAKKLNLPIKIGRWNKPIDNEMEARKARYQFFKKNQKKSQADCIVTAHHLDDQTETILFNLIRGTGLQGLTGISKYKNKIWRPLLDISKKEILDYCQTNHLKFCTDQSNFDTKYTRNFLRHKVIPLLKQINPNLNQTLQQNTLNFQQIQAFLFKKIEKYLTQTEISIQTFLKLDQCLQTELIKQKIKNHTEPSSKKIQEIISIIQKNVGKKYKQFNHIKITIQNGKIIFKTIP